MGLQASLVDRPRHGLPPGHHPQLIDDTLYDAFGQRQVSTMYTALNQYHVVMEVDPQYLAESRRAATTSTFGRRQAAQVPLSAVRALRADDTHAVGQSPGQFPAVTLSFNLAPGVVAGRCGRGDRRGTSARSACRQRFRQFSGNRAGVSSSLASEPYLILAALVTVYIVLGMLYESYIHPITILSTLPSAGVGALLALLLFKTELSVIALIGIILLIGIVKKNAIMMIDFALDAERKEGKTPADAIYRGLPAALPPDHDDDDGGDAGRRAAGGGRAPARSCAGRWESRSSAACWSVRC